MYKSVYCFGSYFIVVQYSEQSTAIKQATLTFHVNICATCLSLSVSIPFQECFLIIYRTRGEKQTVYLIGCITSMVRV